MRKHSLSCDEALARLRAVRPAVQPNDGFMMQLRVYQALLSLPSSLIPLSTWQSILPSETTPRQSILSSLSV
jgi:hypothetical protein